MGINVTGGKTGPTLPSGNTAGKVRIKIVTEESMMFRALFRNVTPV